MTLTHGPARFQQLQLGRRWAPCPARTVMSLRNRSPWKADRRLGRPHSASQRGLVSRGNPFPPAWSPSQAAGSGPDGAGRVRGSPRPSPRPALSRQVDESSSINRAHAALPAARPPGPSASFAARACGWSKTRRGSCFVLNTACTCLPSRPVMTIPSKGSLWSYATFWGLMQTPGKEALVTIEETPYNVPRCESK